jgi:hypothetical protein
MKSTLVGVGLAAVLGAASIVGSTSTSRAALVCTPGNIVGPGSCTETVTFGPTTAGIVNVPLTIDKWVSNASAGFTETLSAANFSFGGSFGISPNVTGLGPGSGTINFDIAASLLYGPGSGAPPNFLNPTLNPTSGTPSMISVTLASGQSINFSSTITVTPATLGPITTGLGGYIGPGTFAALVTSLSSVSISSSGTGGISLSLSTIDAAEIDVTYDFTTTSIATPIPAALPLFATGLGALGLLGWRRKRKTTA